nr:carbohydrate ABC transporter permease [Streptomyces sp. CYG21]
MSAPTEPKAGRSLAARIAARAGGGVMRVFLVLVALFWIMPTIGLFLSSLRAPENIAATGWWRVFTAPSELTFSNYQRLLE